MAGEMQTSPKAGTALPSMGEDQEFQERFGTLNPNSQDPYSRDQAAILGDGQTAAEARKPTAFQGGGGQRQSGPRPRWW